MPVTYEIGLTCDYYTHAISYVKKAKTLKSVPKWVQI